MVLIRRRRGALIRRLQVEAAVAAEPPTAQDATRNKSYGRISPLVNVATLVEGAVVTRSVVVSAHIRQRVSAVIRIRRSNAVTRSRIQQIAVRIATSAYRLVIRRLLPLVLARDGHATSVPSIRIARDGIILRCSLSVQIIDALLSITTSQPIREARRIPETYEIYRFIAHVWLHIVSETATRTDLLNAAMLVAIHI